MGNQSHKMKFTVAFLLVVLAISNAKVNLAHEDSSPADAVIIKINQLMAKTKAELAKNEAIHTADANKCKTEKVFRANEIEQGKGALSNATEQLNLCSNSLTISERSLIHTNSLIEATKLKIKTTITERKHRREVFVTRQKEITATLGAIEQAYPIINQFANANKASFMQLGEKINQIYMVAISHGISADVTPVVMAFAEIAGAPSTVSAGAVAQLTSLFQGLEAKLKATLVRLTQADAVDENTTNAIIKNDNLQLKKLLKLAEDQQTYIAEMKQCVHTETTIVKLSKEKIIRNTAILAKTVKMCASFEASYQSAKKAGEHYLALLGQFKVIVAQAINQYSEGKFTAHSMAQLKA